MFDPNCEIWGVGEDSRSEKWIMGVLESVRRDKMNIMNLF
jgi:hypothetical protein